DRGPGWRGRVGPAGGPGVSRPLLGARAVLKARSPRPAFTAASDSSSCLARLTALSMRTFCRLPERMPVTALRETPECAASSACVRPRRSTSRRTATMSCALRTASRPRLFRDAEELGQNGAAVTPTPPCSSSWPAPRVGPLGSHESSRFPSPRGGPATTQPPTPPPASFSPNAAVVRYQPPSIDRAVSFYPRHFGFHLRM